MVEGLRSRRMKKVHHELRVPPFFLSSGKRNGDSGQSGDVLKPAGGIDEEAAKLGRLFEEALRCLTSTDLDGANAALKKARAETARSVGVIDGAADGRVPVGPRNESEDRGQTWVIF